MPPNDPNNGRPGPVRSKDDPDDGRQRRRDGRGQLNENGEMDIIGDLRDQGFVMVLFLMGLASYLLREQCTC
eukprot:CAMPEP_0197834882 /NCGR_PEP_ID=MMETSP1437-20131217/24042_1 /TAXON_ID=49252 ORGANISM="Eucampia antarctica, Strain CCMP1452" /NCGR_SAMPLE_ID=MMETSP1437 /ASSEMBLY_ACC=CAM_ASM_001096 /LENGTH=71 /DNA_ID=CAMNT_0043439919 /DNA_START=162 /DNA_END=377 /DNA_ORIENTATION=-